MANFRNGLIVTGSTFVTGTVTASHGFMGDVVGTSSFASHSLTAVSASFLIGGGGTGITGIIVERTGSVDNNNIQILNFIGSAVTSISSSNGRSTINLSSTSLPNTISISGDVTASSFSGSIDYAFVRNRPSSSIVNTNWSSGSTSLTQTFTIPNAVVGQIVSLHEIPPSDPDEVEMDTIVGSGFVSSTNTVTLYLHAHPGPIAGIRPINIMLGV